MKDNNQPLAPRNSLPPHLFIVGRKNSGKTALIIRLIPEFHRRGKTVGVIKNDACNTFDWDTPGKDTHDFRDCGADIVGINSGSNVAVNYRNQGFKTVELRTILMSFYQTVDLVLIEGFSFLEGKRIEMTRSGLSGELNGPLEKLVATAGDRLLTTGRPHFELKRSADLADYLLADLGLFNREHF